MTTDPLRLKLREYAGSLFDGVIDGAYIAAEAVDRFRFQNELERYVTQEKRTAQLELLDRLRESNDGTYEESDGMLDQLNEAIATERAKLGDK